MYEFVILTVFPFAVIFAASLDLVSYRIPNLISLFLVYAFLAVFPFAADASLNRFAWHIAAALVVFIPTFTLFAFRLLGGGDVKLLSAIALWIGWDLLPTFLVVAAVLGGVLATVLILFRAMPIPAAWLRQSWIAGLYHTGGSLLKGKMPYGVALSAAALIVYPYTTWFLRVTA